MVQPREVESGETDSIKRAAYMTSTEETTVLPTLDGGACRHRVRYVRKFVGCGNLEGDY